MGEYVSIKKFAEMADVSQQSIYKRLKKENNPIQQYVKLVEGDKQVISVEALNLYNKKKNEEIHYIEDEDEGKEKKPAAAADELVKAAMETLQSQLEYQKEMLREKDKQIASLLSRLEETTKALDQQQHLNVIDKSKILELEEKAKSIEEDNNKKWYHKWFG